ncbi:N-acetylglucosamine-6-phosphate deacetylase [Agaribacter flavus]|uniref:N-acetylgalactosamine-6-phosphate deacetylase n=1 Tax=Agaribacter flavus TaxID=1902781 RepID=A0ABV7FUT0_9ALTE
MATTRYFCKNLYNGENWQQNRLIIVAQDIIQDVIDGTPEQADKVLSSYTTPGFIDTQVNGGGGELFNHTPTADTLMRMLRAHAKFGTTQMLPTLITDNYACMQAAADAMASMQDMHLKGFIGIHFEGPHLSLPKRGIHPAKQIRPISNKEMSLFCRKDIGQVLLTLAPETVPLEQIHALQEAGVIISLGHSNATYTQALSAIDAGATGFTHLFNAMSMSKARDPGVVGTALDTENTFAGIIVDTHHVHQANCQIAIKCKTPDRLMLVTDAMNHADAPEAELIFNGEQIVLENGKLTTPDGTLAGSALDMITAVKNTHQWLNVPLEIALQMASTSPAAFLGLSKKLGKVKAGFQADFVSFDDNYKVNTAICAGKSLLS